MAKNKKSSTSPKADERNIVGPDSLDLQDLETEVILIWEKNKGLILGGVAFVFAVFIGFQGIKFLQTKAEQSLKEGYQAASSSEAKAAWAEDEAGSPLGGFAFKELGDEAFAAGDLAQAESYYRKAAKSAAAPIDEAATIALAVTLIEQDRAAEAKPLLLAMAGDPTAFAQAEAQYRLAALASAEGDATTARSFIESISEEAFFWKSRAESIAAKLPEA